MKVLISNDLHSWPPWYKFLEDFCAIQTPSLVCLAGDLVEGFVPRPFLYKTNHVSQILEKITKTGVTIAACSGNHEAFIKDFPNLSENVNFIGDARTKLIKGPSPTVITTLPYMASPILRESLLNCGKILKESTSAKWIVLHHEPPVKTAVGGLSGSPYALSMIKKYQPDFFLSGHLHNQPLKKSGRFIDQVGKTFCINPGQVDPETSGHPNHVILETTTGDIMYRSFWGK